MQKRPKRRRVLKWVGVLACVLLGATWAADWPQYAVYRSRGRWLCGIGYGCLVFGVKPVASTTSRWALGRDADITISVPRIMPDSGGTCVYMPLWILLLTTAIPTAILWRRDRRRHPPGRCKTCGYDLTGNVTGRCPECGKGI